MFARPGDEPFVSVVFKETEELWSGEELHTQAWIIKLHLSVNL